MESTIKIRPACFADVLQIPLGDGYIIDPPEKVFENEEWFSEHAIAVEKKGRLVAVFGVKSLWEGCDGVGHCFAFIDKDPGRYKKTLIVTGRIAVEMCIRKFNYWRLQSTVDTKFKAGIEYMMAMGFSIDGLMPKFGPDKSDHLMMSRIVNGRV